MDFTLQFIHIEINLILPMLFYAKGHKQTIIIFSLTNYVLTNMFPIL